MRIKIRKRKKNEGKRCSVGVELVGWGSRWGDKNKRQERERLRKIKREFIEEGGGL